MSGEEPQAAESGVDIHLVVTGGTAHVVDGPPPPMGGLQPDRTNGEQTHPGEGPILGGDAGGGPQPDRPPLHIHLYFAKDPEATGGPQPD